MSKTLSAQPGVRVWDRWVRSIHWGLLVLIVVALNTHGGWRLAHRIAGYAVLALLGLRLVWGLVGGPYARFSSFVPQPAQLWRYVWQMLRRLEPRLLGHNPAGAVMVLLLWATLLAITVTGACLDTTTWRDYRPLHAWHDGLSDALLGLVGLHLLGVLYTSLRHRENLVLAMLTGQKRPLAAGKAHED